METRGKPHTHTNLTWSGKGQESICQEVLAVIASIIRQVSGASFVQSHMHVPRAVWHLYPASTRAFSLSYTASQSAWMGIPGWNGQCYILSVCASPYSGVSSQQLCAAARKGEEFLVQSSGESQRKPTSFIVVKISHEPWEAKHKVRKKNLLYRRERERKSTSFSNCCAIVNTVMNKAMESF